LGIKSQPLDGVRLLSLSSFTARIVNVQSHSLAKTVSLAAANLA